MNERLVRAIGETSESAGLDFKLSFNPDDPRERCEVLKDIVAMANTGGGVIIFGVDDTGQVQEGDLDPIRLLDAAKVSDWIYKYTLTHFGGVRIVSCEKDGKNIVALSIEAAVVPLVFVNPGTYSPDGKNQKSVFGRGTVYFRHGAKSETATTDDLRRAMEHFRDTAIESLKDGLRRIMEAPVGSKIVVSDEIDVNNIHLVDDEFTQPVRLLAPDATHPYRQKDVVAKVREQLGEGVVFNSHDVKCIRRVYSIDDNPNYYYRSKLDICAQYSRSFVDFIIASCQMNPNFLDDTRVQYSVLLASQK